MGSQQSKRQPPGPQVATNKPTNMGQQSSTPVNAPAKQPGSTPPPPTTSPATTKQEEEAAETEYRPPRKLSSLNNEEGTKKAVPSKLNRFRVKVPPSMAAGDIMTIKLNGILTKVLIATPTTTTTSSTNKTSSGAVKQSPSREATSCDSTSSSSCPSPSHVEKQVAETKSIDSVFASTDATVPEGKMIVEAKPVIVVHAVFTEDDKEMKEQMADEAIREIIQGTVDAGCNALLGMTISIKKQPDNICGYLVKACGTPCLLMPAQVLLGPPAASLPVPVRKRTSSTELLPARRQ